MKQLLCRPMLMSLLILSALIRQSLHTKRFMGGLWMATSTPRFWEKMILDLTLLPLLLIYRVHKSMKYAKLAGKFNTASYCIIRNSQRNL
ncbi:unnamed protein product [Cuscuta campestris]|uniref:Uncharacterized protein n=1 Tax=Cuscuta campestris TaxID=132261 RepID=A0A484LXT9_9ASTE|nr:unnamed protein product [Cuscuta campestris]